jgi:hypothetical protein
VCNVFFIAYQVAATALPAFQATGPVICFRSGSFRLSETLIRIHHLLERLLGHHFN